MTFQHRSSRSALRVIGWLWLLVWMLVPVAAEPMVVFLKNGDRLSGEITSENDQRIVLKSALTGRIVIPRNQIERVMTAAAFVASNAPAAVVPEAVVAAPAPAALPPPTPSATAPAALTNAPTIAEPWLPGWFTGVWTNWHGNAQLGATLGFGSTDRYSMFLNATAAKKWGRTTSLLNYSLSYGVVDAVENANRMSGDAKVDIEFTKSRRLYSYGLGGAGYDLIRDITLEYHIGTGLGYKFIDRSKLVVAGELGGQYQVYNYNTAPDKYNVAARLGENLTTQIAEKVTLTQRFGFTPGIEDPADYQIRFGVTLSCPLFNPMTLNLNLANEYDSQPAPGISNNDLQISTTIGINF